MPYFHFLMGKPFSHHCLPARLVPIATSTFSFFNEQASSYQCLPARHTIYGSLREVFPSKTLISSKAPTIPLTVAEFSKYVSKISSSLCSGQKDVFLAFDNCVFFVSFRLNCPICGHAFLERG